MSGTTVEKSEFVFVQDGEFEDPCYEYLLDSEICGYLEYTEGNWRGCLNDSHVYSAGAFEEMAEKIDQLNADLAEQRKEFFGII